MVRSGHTSAIKCRICRKRQRTFQLGRGSSAGGWARSITVKTGRQYAMIALRGRFFRVLSDHVAAPLVTTGNPPSGSVRPCKVPCFPIEDLLWELLNILQPLYYIRHMLRKPWLVVA